ncbi:MAG: hypothetical protein IJX65_05710 [Alistipes sp.]|nr:hypothetical protein [Alistipes sp.]
MANSYNSFTNIYDCADSHYSEGTVCYKCTPSNKNPHQFRLNNQSLQEFALQVKNALNNWSEINSFEDLFAKIKAVVEEIKGEDDKKYKLGELVVYDCAARIAFLKYMRNEGDYRPKEQVYIHAGVYKGAKWLFDHKYITIKPKCNNVIPVEAFCDEHFKSLFEALSLAEFEGFTKSMILESFMCMMMEKEPPKFCKKCRLKY